MVYAEAGCNWLSDRHQCLVALVIKNRVLDPRFPNTIIGVLSQPGQYEPYLSGYFYSQNPDSRTIENCRKVLSGEFNVNANIIWQAGFIQGPVLKLFMMQRLEQLHISARKGVL